MCRLGNAVKHLKVPGSVFFVAILGLANRPRTLHSLHYSSIIQNHTQIFTTINNFCSWNSVNNEPAISFLRNTKTAYAVVVMEARGLRMRLCVGGFLSSDVPRNDITEFIIPFFWHQFTKQCATLVSSRSFNSLLVLLILLHLGKPHQS
jgi:hypothetical protein